MAGERLHAYCVRRAGDPRPAPGLSGVLGGPVRVVEEAGLGMWVSDVGDPGTTVERLREHDRVVRAALRSATPLPVRFGTGFRDEDAAREALRSGADAFHASLERVAERAEMGVRVGWDLDAERALVESRLPPAPPPGEVRTGRDFLEARRRDFRAEEGLRLRAEELLDRVERELSEPGVPSVRTLLMRPEAAGSVAHLVHRSRLRTYRERFESARATLGDLHLTLSGPWAPYSFVDRA